MGIEERRQREKKAFAAKVLENAYTIIKEGGLEALSMRRLARTVEYSASKLYQFFDNKDKILWALCEEICQRMCEAHRGVPRYRDKEKYLLELARSTVEFHAKEPESIEVLNYICFGPGDIEPPPAYSKAVDFYFEAIKELNYPSLRTAKQVEEALDIIRVVLVGITTIMQTESGDKRYRQTVRLMDNCMKVLISGWREDKEEE